MRNKKLTAAIFSHEVRDGLNVLVAKVDTFKNDLQSFYDIIKCDCIDIVEREFNGVRYNIIVDDEGLLKENDITMIARDGREILVGNLIIVPLNEETPEELGTFANKQKAYDFIQDYLANPFYDF